VCSKKAYDVDFGDVHCGVVGLIARASLCPLADCSDARF